MNKKSVALASSVLIAFALAVVGIGMAKRPPARPGGPQPQFTSSVQPQAGKTGATADSRSLKEKAKEAGAFVGTAGPKSAPMYADLAQLSKQSTAVVIGTAQENHPTLSADGKSITINYNVRIEYVYKGKLKQGNNILVSVPGGKVTFADGTSAEVRTGWFKKMQNSKTYALFLSPGEGSRSFVTTGEAQGLFEIPTSENNRVVKTHSGLPRDPIAKYQGTDVKTFLKELRQVTNKPLKS